MDAYNRASLDVKASISNQSILLRRDKALISSMETKQMYIWNNTILENGPIQCFLFFSFPPEN